MSWKDNINQAFTITTGDGVVYTPLWDATRSVSLAQAFNIAKFDFRGVSGTLVDRTEAIGNVYDIEVVFQGDDHLIKAKDFRESAADRKSKRTLKLPWTINHPYYGILVVQPVYLKYNNEDGNISRITGQVIETIKADNVGPGVSPFDKIQIDKLSTDSTFFAAYVTAVPVPKIVDINGMTVNLQEIDTKVSPLIKLSEDFNKFKNVVSTAGAWITKATSYPGTAIASIQAVISAPAKFIDTVVNKLTTLEDAYAGLYNYVNYGIGAAIKKLYENNAGTAISSMCLASVSNITQDDYKNVPAVLSVIQTITDNYNDYLSNLDTLQSVNGSGVNSYMPDADSINALSALVNYTVSQLLIIAANAKQKNIIFLDNDENVIPLCYRLYGNVQDATLDQFISDNGIGYKAMLRIPKGTEIIYYS